jgi:hypothetical protein
MLSFAIFHPAISCARTFPPQVGPAINCPLGELPAPLAAALGPAQALEFFSTNVADMPLHLGALFRMGFLAIVTPCPTRVPAKPPASEKFLDINGSRQQDPALWAEVPA